MSDADELIAALGGEAVTYVPHGGEPKTIQAIVWRQPLLTDTSGGATYALNQIEVHISRDATLGVAAVQPRKDRMQFKRALEDALTTEFLVQKIIEQDTGLGDGGMTRLMVQA